MPPPRTNMASSPRNGDVCAPLTPRMNSWGLPQVRRLRRLARPRHTHRHTLRHHRCVVFDDSHFLGSPRPTNPRTVVEIQHLRCWIVWFRLRTPHFMRGYRSSSPPGFVSCPLIASSPRIFPFGTPHPTNEFVGITTDTSSPTTRMSSAHLARQTHRQSRCVVSDDSSRRGSMFNTSGVGLCVTHYTPHFMRGYRSSSPPGFTCPRITHRHPTASINASSSTTLPGVGRCSTPPVLDCVLLIIPHISCGANDLQALRASSLVFLLHPLRGYLRSSLTAPRIAPQRSS